MAVRPTRRDLLRAGTLIAGGALIPVAWPSPATAALPALTTPALTPPVFTMPAFTTRTAATRVASRSDRRPVAGGVYDATVQKTFISWGGRNQDTYVQAFDHRTATFSAAVRVVGGRGDSHNYPTMVQADDGHLLIFVGMHNVEMVMARSPRPRSVDGTWTTRVIPAGRAASYPMPFKAANGHLFVFFRETTRTLNSSVPVDTRPTVYMRSTDNGQTWASSKQLTPNPYAIGSTNRGDNLNEIYMGQLRWEPATDGRPERVHLVWALAGGGPEGHAHARYLKNMHYATFNPNTLRFAAANGQDLGTQIDNTDQDRSCRVATTPLERPAGTTSPNTIQLGGAFGDGRPFVVWFTHDANLLFHNHVSIWTGQAWQTRELATGLRTREMEPVDPSTWRVYTTRDLRPNIETYLVGQGHQWTAESVITTPKPVQRIELIGSYRDPARILASGASSARPVSVADGDIYIAGTATST